MVYPRLQQQLQLASFVVTIMALLQIALGLVVLLGWLWGHSDLTVLAPGFPTMKANTATGFLLAGSGLLLMVKRCLMVTLIIGFALMTTATVSFLQYPFEINTGIDQFWVEDTSSDQFPGRPSEMTAFVFIITGLVLMIVAFRKHQYPAGDEHNLSTNWGLNTLIVVGCSPALIGLFTYFYLPEALFETRPFASMTIYTCLGFVAFFYGISLRSKGSILREILFRDTPGGRYFRRMILPILIFPIVFGFVVQYATGENWLQPAFATALFASIMSLVFVMALSYSANQQDRWQLALSAQADARAQAESKMSLVWESDQAAVMLFDERGFVHEANPGAVAVFGWSIEEMKTMHLREFMPEASRHRHELILHNAVHDNSVNRYTMDDPERVFGLNRDGKKVPLVITVSRQNVGGKIFFGAVMLQVDKLSQRVNGLIKEVNMDELTRVGNRKSLEKRLAALSRHRLRDGYTVAVLMLDIDYFKHINDRWGHTLGDKVLRGFADRVSGCLRHGDSLYRYGGEEFVALVVCEDLEQAEAVARRILRSLASAPIPAEDQALTVSCSMGIALIDESITSARECLKLADQALYAAKASGRKRYVCSAWLDRQPPS
tara:strand:- start:3015 stop:4832 length:1818 start_codon:yes stop_codon:yes gene_type:complete